MNTKVRSKNRSTKANSGTKTIIYRNHEVEGNRTAMGGDSRFSQQAHQTRIPSFRVLDRVNV